MSDEKEAYCDEEQEIFDMVLEELEECEQHSGLEIEIRDFKW